MPDTSALVAAGISAKNMQSPSETYVDRILLPQLRTLRLDERQQIIVAKDVCQRVDSLLRHWHDEAYRRTVLTPGIEEGSFYEPLAAGLVVRALVVVAVRNSLIEDLAASRSASAELKLAGPVLTDSEMPYITGAAIRFFDTLDLHKLKPAPQSANEPDIFDSLPAKCRLMMPISCWRTFSRAGMRPTSFAGRPERH